MIVFQRSPLHAMEAPLAAALAALAKDDVAALSAAVGAGLSIDGFYWHAGQQRSLLQLAALAGAACCAAALLAAGAAVDAPSPSDGNTALHCACSTASSGTARTIALLMKGGASRAALNHARQTPSDLLEQETSQAACPQPAAAAPADSDLLRPEYCTDDFRMFSFKIDCCPRLAESHDWTLCPFQHPGTRAGAAVGAGTARPAAPDKCRPTASSCTCMARSSCCRREGAPARPPLLQVPRCALPRFPQGHLQAR
jgi:hypothetical protein